jgi:predicted AAA+ superfamily ATPase
VVGVKEICTPWDDGFDVSLDEYLAPELGDLLSEKRNIYTEPYEFFSRTYLTNSILLWGYHLRWSHIVFLFQ